jgi:Ni,Fe-hydrogenase maturation factor
LVLFFDAACVGDIENARPGEVRVREVSAEEFREHNPGQFSHVYSPAKVLDLARELYQATPMAFVITVAGEDFGHGDSLSPTVAQALPLLVTEIENMVQRFLSG